MSNPEYLGQLIDLASKAAGSDYQLAKQLSQPRSAVSMWRKGKKTCPAADQALMADIAGLDPEAWLARATVAQYEGTPKGARLSAALGKVLAATGGAIVSSGAAAADIARRVIDTMCKALTPFVQK